MITVGSVFSGIGGIELGLERTGGFETLWFCENEPYSSKVLKKNFLGVPNLGDITKVDWYEVEKPNMLTGGFPCQDTSIAGKGKGIQEGTRSGLWREFAKALRILRPKYALIENVPMLARRGLNIVLADIAACGYDAEWNIISAESVGAPHKRERMFIVAYPYRNGCKGDKCKSGHSQAPPEAPFIFGQKQMEHVHSDWEEQLSESFLRRVVTGVPNHLDRLKCLGNAVVPQVAQTVGEWILESVKNGK